MKKSMIFAAVAAMFMFSSCQKEELEPGQDSQSEELVFTASIDQNSTKTIINTDGTDETNRGKIEWVEGDEITITDAESTSVVYVAESSGESVSFKKKDGETKSLAAGSSYSATYKTAPATAQAYADYYSAVNQAKDLYMTAPSTDGTELTFSAACGLLKLNLTASTEGTDKTISKIEIVGIPTGGSAAVYTLTCDNKSIESAKDFYIALPAGSYTLMKFTNSKGSVCFKKKASGMTIAANKINSLTLSGIIFSAILPGRFTVASGKQVQFTTANLWCNASASPVTYSFESAQNVTYATLGQSSYDASHVCHFFWTSLTDYQSGTASYMPYASSYSYSSQSTSDKFWCGEDNKLTVDGQSGLYALTGGYSGEWYYLFNSRTKASSLYKEDVCVTTSAGTVARCLVIAPDDYTGTIAESYDAAAWATAEASGLVCLPAAGLWYNSNLDNAGSNGYYWSATPSEDYKDYAHTLSFGESSFFPSLVSSRYFGYSVRLVYSEGPVYPEAPELACVKIGDVWWAPVNCGYDATNYPYGLLYQWGRKYGQGYDSETPTVVKQNSQLSTVAAGSDASNKYNFYCGNDVWTSASTSATDDWFTTYNPCPDGWRVPTYAELNALIGNSGTAFIGSGGWDSTEKGYWFNGTKSPSSGSGLFLPAAGYRNYYNGGASLRGSDGNYWCSSAPRDVYAWCLGFDSGGARLYEYRRANGYSVRCVQE